MKKDIFEKLDKKNFPKKYDELTYDNLNEVIENIKNLPENETSLLMFDDMTAYLKSDKNIVTLLKDICNNRRHYHVSIFFLVQTFKSLPTEIRRLLENLFIFKVSKETFDTIFDELLEDYNTKQIKKDLMKMVFDKPHNFLFVNTNTQRLFKNFDEIIVGWITILIMIQI